TSPQQRDFALQAAPERPPRPCRTGSRRWLDAGEALTEWRRRRRTVLIAIRGRQSAIAEPRFNGADNAWIGDALYPVEPVDQARIWVDSSGLLRRQYLGFVACPRIVVVRQHAKIHGDLRRDHAALAGRTIADGCFGQQAVE